MKLEIVIDSNILFRILISQGNIIDLFFNEKIKIFAPIKLKEEFTKNKEEIVQKSKLSEKDFENLSSLLFSIITFIPIEHYKTNLQKAKEILKNHEKDEDFIALCLSKNIKLWTYEKLLFDIGFGISTKTISNKINN